MKSLLRRYTIPSAKLLPNQEAFDFLSSCSQAKFDLTSVEAIAKAPEKVLHQIRNTEVDYKRFKGLSTGSLSVLQSCSNFLRSNNISCETRNISLSDGVLSGISKVYETLRIGGSDKIILPTPTFGYYFQQLRDKGIDFETIATTKEQGFLPNPDILEAAVKKGNSKVLLLCYPNNPTGTLMNQETAEAISEIAKRHDLFVISDEAFLGNVLSPEKNFSIARVPGMLDRSATFFSISKMMGLPSGAASNFCFGNKDLIGNFSKVGGYYNEQVTREALEDSQENREFLAENKRKYLANIDLIKNKISQLNKKFGEIFGKEKSENQAYVKPLVSDPKTGGVYLIDFSGLRDKIYNGKKFDTGLDVAKWLLKEASLGSVPGECFMFPPEEMLVRIATSESSEIKLLMQ